MTELIGVVIVAFVVLFFVLPILVGFLILLVGTLGAAIAGFFRFINPR